MLQIVNPVFAITRVQNVLGDFSNLVQTELRNELGTRSMSHILSSKSELSAKLTVILNHGMDLGIFKHRLKKSPARFVCSRE